MRPYSRFVIEGNGKVLPAETVTYEPVAAQSTSRCHFEATGG